MLLYSRGETTHLRRLAAAVLFVLIFASRLFAQGGNASVSGFVQDPSKAYIPDVSVVAVNTDTNQQFEAKTNKDGSYSLPSLPVGPYRIQLEKTGFRSIVREGLFLHTQDVLQFNFQMEIGQASETVTVNSEGNTINTSDASVGTVIDRKFVEDMPLNGRSFQTLVLLSPGVITNTPQAASSTPPSNDQGEYSVNGMRSDSNNFMVDGVSASNMASNSSNAASAGMLGSATALGTTQAMLSVDAMEEFRITTSTYSAEFGRQPGAQVSFRTRSGTNLYHGTAYDYLRNSALDANNWFNTYNTTPIPTPAERQNDFGGTFAGPLSIPHVYSGKDRAFFFFAYEGLRLDQPQAATINDVPSNGTYNTGTYTNAEYKNLRLYAPARLQPLLNAYPLPNCSTAQDPQCVDYGEGGSPYIQSPTSTGVIDSESARVDYQLLPTLRLFARYNDTTSSQIVNALYRTASTYRSRIYLVGVDNAFGTTISNELRLQYSPALAVTASTLYPVGGSVAIDLNAPQGTPTVGGETKINIELPNSALLYQQSYGSKQFQPNVTDVLTWTHGKHLYKAGVDYRQTTAYYGDGSLSRGPYFSYTYNSTAKVLEDEPSISAKSYLRTDPTTKNLGLFVQDDWRIKPRVTLSLGLRWDLAPPPSESGAQMYTYTGNIDNPASLALSKPGAPLYRTTYYDFGPRIGVAATIFDQPGHELVFRAGAGLFYDTIALNQTYGAGFGVGTASTGSYSGTSYAAGTLPPGTTFGWPGNPAELLPITTTPPYALEEYPNNRITPPPAVQWNATFEQALGGKQSVTMGYVASMGLKLATYQEYDIATLNPLFTDVYLYQNGPGSNYNSLQVKYQRQVANGLQAIGAFTWSHMIDWASTEDYDAVYPLQRGNSNFDVRENFTGALVYNLPTRYSNRLENAVLGHWNIDGWFVARTAFPWEPVGPAITDPLTGDVINSELNYNGAQNPYVRVHGIPGGIQINPADFSITKNLLGAGNAPRNFLRGFGEAQANLAVQRDFPLSEKARLQFRTEAFNILNHPNFGTVSTTCGPTTAGATCNSTLMGQATNTLSTGLGGLSSLYQQGGPRSLQFMLKLQF
jgi:Carboxypeptidase regulatory-like domain/TonB-dependent Receptor Plug Domain